MKLTEKLKVFGPLADINKHEYFMLQGDDSADCFDLYTGNLKKADRKIALHFMTCWNEHDTLKAKEEILEEIVACTDIVKPDPLTCLARLLDKAKELTK